jgi:pyrroloquinoline quinone (PQQ) biosynthesis protein C
MSFFISLVELTDAHRRELETVPRVHSMIHHGLSLGEYQGLLHDLYHIVWHFCPIMAAAAARCDDRHRDVRYDLYARIEEEKGHDAWVLEDVVAMGGAAERTRSTPPSAPVQAMIAFNYHGADRVHPCSVLGMLYMLEVVSSVYGGRVADSIAAKLQRPVEAGGFKFLTSHAAMDLDHMAKLNQLVKTIDDPAAQEAIVNSTRVNFFQFCRMFEDGGSIAQLAA